MHSTSTHYVRVQTALQVLTLNFYALFLTLSFRFCKHADLMHELTRIHALNVHKYVDA